MFSAQTYKKRREDLKKSLKKGLVLLPGNIESPMNYSANIYHFRQDSTFLYYFGIDAPQIAGVIDADSGKEILFADELTIEDILWMGQQETFKEKAAKAGIDSVLPARDLQKYLDKAVNSGQRIHYLPPYQQTQVKILKEYLGKSEQEVQNGASIDLIKAIVKQRAVKTDEEIAEIEKAVNTTYLMHTAAMRMAKEGMVEQEITGHIEGIAMSNGTSVSFPIILSMDVQILHNHNHGNLLQNGRLVVNDSGAETNMHYAADITRTFPVSGKFTPQQKDIYEIVLKSQMEAIAASKPGIRNKDIHLQTALIIADGLKNLGLIKGNIEEAVHNGAHALFFPHGLGHMMGLDVHDMENYGEDNVGYDQEVKRSDQFGLAYLRLGRKLREGFVVTIEPGVYFIPELIQKWKGENKFTEFINYDKAEQYIGFSGVRIEDDILITADGSRVLGRPIPKTIADVEEMCRS